MRRSPPSVLLAAAAVALAVLAPRASAYNITKILAAHPEFSTFNQLLSETRLATEINRRATITVLAVDNAGMQSLLDRHFTLPTIRHILSLHILTDYYGAKKLHGLSKGSTASASLFQATGAAPGTTGYVNITDKVGGHVSMTAEDAMDGTSPVTFVKSIKEMPYDLAVLQVSGIMSSPDAEAPVPPPAPVNLTEIMSKQYCGAFANLLISSGVMKTFDDNVNAGLTVFCPTDAAVAAFLPKFKNLTAKGQTNILLYHGVPNFYSLQQLKSNNGLVSTLATVSEVKKDYSYTIQNNGETVSIETKVDTPEITATVDVEDPQIAVYAINHFLEPKEIFKLAAAPSPAPAKKGKKKPGDAASSPDSADSPDSAPADKAASDKAGAAESLDGVCRFLAATAAAVIAAAIIL